MTPALNAALATTIFLAVATFISINVRDFPLRHLQNVPGFLQSSESYTSATLWSNHLEQDAETRGATTSS